MSQALPELQWALNVKNDRGQSHTRLTTQPRRLPAVVEW